MSSISCDTLFVISLSNFVQIVVENNHEDEPTSDFQPESKNKKTTANDDESSAHRHMQLSDKTCSKQRTETDSTIQPADINSPDDGASEAPIDSVDPDSGLPGSAPQPSSAGSQYGSDSQQLPRSLRAVPDHINVTVVGAVGFEPELEMPPATMAGHYLPSTSSMAVQRNHNGLARFSRMEEAQFPPRPTAMHPDPIEHPQLSLLERANRVPTGRSNSSFVDFCVRDIDLNLLDKTERLEMFKEIDSIVYTHQDDVLDHLLTDEALAAFERDEHPRDKSYFRKGLKYWMDWEYSPSSKRLFEALMLAKCSPKVVKIFQVREI